MSTKAKGEPTAAKKAGDAIKTEAVEIESAMQAGAEAVEAAVERVVEASQAQVEKAGAMVAGNLDAMTRTGQGTMESLLQAGTSLAKGVGEMNRAVFAFAQSSLAANFNAARQMMTCASVKEAMDIQASHMKASFDSLLAEGGKIGEIASATLTETMAPIGRELKAGFGRAMGPQSV
ncbi:MAG: phasin family protein [Alphaproteobacteria bacterium]